MRSRQPSKTAQYELWWSDLLSLNDRVAGLSREEKDRQLIKFANMYGLHIQIGQRAGGLYEVNLDRNLVNYLGRTKAYTAEQIRGRVEAAFNGLTRRL